MNDLSEAFTAPAVDWWALTPQLVLLGTALVVLLVTSLARRTIPVWFSTTATTVAGAGAFVVALTLWANVNVEGSRTTLNGALNVDGFSLFFTVLTALGVLATALIAHDYVRRHALAAPELAALLLASAAGAIVMASANDLIVLFLGLETLSIALYVLIALHISRSDARESAIKYFVLGALSSAFFLYGVALVYGATGTTNLSGIGEYMDSVVLRDEQLLLAGVALLVVGLAFKVAAVPFHMWAPDVYQGAPSPITGYLASIAKAAGFAALLRVLLVAFARHSVAWAPVLTGLAFASLAVGAVLAIRQDDVKRMLAFSSISHAGFVLIGVQAASSAGASAALFYLFVYSFMTLGSFTVLTLMRTESAPELVAVGGGSSDGGGGSSDGGGGSSDGGSAPLGAARSRHHISYFAGLARSHPVLALAFTVLLLAQAGVPLTSGFISKFQVIAAAIDGGGYVLAVVAMLTAVISAFAYLRVVLSMYAPADATSSAAATTPAATTPAETASSPTATDVVQTPIPLTARLALVALVGITIVAGIIPQFLITFAIDAVSAIIPS